uniref:proline-rich protein 29-like n=1 Tax=Centroberyx gerrardi TaxID=166262 RepID=UPI003AAD5720
MPPGSAPSIRPGGHVKEDLVELMMIQNAQMHQVIMNNMTVSALSSFGYSGPPPEPAATRNLVIIQEGEDDPEEYHHYYQPAPCLSYPAWLPRPMPHPTLVYQDPTEVLEPASSPSHRDRRAVPPPPPPSAAGTVGADVPPAAGTPPHSDTQPAAN